jgi:N-acetylmuramoyl-L-alanine amidase
LWKQRPKPDDIRRARNLLLGHRDPKAKKSLWFYNPTPGIIVWVCTQKMPRSPKTQLFTKYKNHCFYVGVPGYCKEFYGY